MPICMGVYAGKRKFAYLNANAHMHAFVLNSAKWRAIHYKCLHSRMTDSSLSGDNRESEQQELERRKACLNFVFLNVLQINKLFTKSF